MCSVLQTKAFNLIIMTTPGKRERENRDHEEYTYILKKYQDEIGTEEKKKKKKKNVRI